MLSAKYNLNAAQAAESVSKESFEPEKGKTVAIGKPFGESPRRQQERWLSG